MQGTPAGFPAGIPGMGEDMDGAIQQAPHFSLQIIDPGIQKGISANVLINLAKF